MKKKKPETTVDTIDEKEPAAKERFCVKCKMKLASDNKLPFCPACWEQHHGLRKESQIGSRSIGATFAKKVRPESRQGGTYGA